MSPSGAIELRSLGTEGKVNNKDWRTHWTDDNTVLQCQGCKNVFQFHTRKVQSNRFLKKLIIWNNY